MNFLKIDYLVHGNQKQQDAFRELQSLRLFEVLKPYHPLLAGTIPINIDIKDSDLDIICQCKEHQKLIGLVTDTYGEMRGFEVNQRVRDGIDCTVIRFYGKQFLIEIFAQDIPSEEQHAFRHMLIEDQILKMKGEDFRQEVLKLKERGIKTEPAFVQLLGLKGDPYKALLAWKVD
ncbi:DUF4269 domain-containing protein [Limibacter armeniacum]|uniref:DUF4269 domain-containing protein n=1 Tax=Limibacter armeniacum TaxID=466084 RepID=UPI002FE530CA